MFSFLFIIGFVLVYIHSIGIQSKAFVKGKMFTISQLSQQDEFKLQEPARGELAVKKNSTTYLASMIMLYWINKFFSIGWTDFQTFPIIYFIRSFFTNRFCIYSGFELFTLVLIHTSPISMLKIKGKNKLLRQMFGIYSTYILFESEKYITHQ